MSKGTMDTFNLSVTSAVPELALVELGYTDAEIAKTIVNPVEGENFAPAFLKIVRFPPSSVLLPLERICLH